MSDNKNWYTEKYKGCPECGETSPFDLLVTVPFDGWICDKVPGKVNWNLDA